MKNLFKQSDYNIVNLEAPVTNSRSKIIKTGPYLQVDKNSTLEVLKALEINLCTLANNHILDYDEQGVFETLDFCKKNGIDVIGAGKNRVEAAKFFYLDSEMGKITLINIAENEWASATGNTAGANGMDLIDDVKAIQKAKQQSEFVFVIVHGGHEYYNLPSPRMQKQYRFYIDNGADLVVGHHTHCISGMETYNGKPIYYSLGNFLFTKPSRYEDWYKGIVLEIEIDDNRLIYTEPIFVQQSVDEYKISIVEGEELKDIKRRFDDYSDTITDSQKLLLIWLGYISEKLKIYNNYWSPLSFIKNRLIKWLAIKLQINGSNKLGKTLYLNLMRCEAHYDMSKEILKRAIIK